MFFSRVYFLSGERFVYIRVKQEKSGHEKK